MLVWIFIEADFVAGFSIGVCEATIVVVAVGTVVMVADWEEVSAGGFVLDTFSDTVTVVVGG